MGVNTITARPINVIHCPLEDGVVCRVVAINATRSGYKYGNEESQYAGKEKRLFLVGGTDSKDGENVMSSFALKGERDRRRALK
jgi:hypothetical protein